MQVRELLKLPLNYFQLLSKRRSEILSAKSNGIVISFEIIPKPESMALRLFMSLWLIAPIMGAAMI